MSGSCATMNRTARNNLTRNCPLCPLVNSALALLGIALLGIALLGIAPDTLGLWGTKCCLMQYFVNLPSPSARGDNGHSGEPVLCKRVRLQSKLVSVFPALEKKDRNQNKRKKKQIR